MLNVKHKTYSSVFPNCLAEVFLSILSQEIVEMCMANFFGETKTFYFEKGRKAGVPFPTAPADSCHSYMFFIHTIFNSFVSHRVKDLVVL